MFTYCAFLIFSLSSAEVHSQNHFAFLTLDGGVGPLMKTTVQQTGRVAARYNPLSKKQWRQLIHPEWNVYL